MADSPLVTYYYPAPAHGGGQSPNIGVIHSIESPLAPGYARTLTGPAYFGGSSAGVSSHYVVDPVDTCQGVPENIVGYHVGGGNNGTIAVEQSGYARFSRPEWLTANGVAQHKRVAALLADINRRRPLIRLKWLNDGELRAAFNNKSGPGGWATHNQFRRVIGGTSHHDPWQDQTDGVDYPWIDVMNWAIEIRGGGAPTGTTPTAPAGEEDDMAGITDNIGVQEATIQVVNRALNRAFNGEVDDGKIMFEEQKLPLSTILKIMNDRAYQDRAKLDKIVGWIDAQPK